jgi:hypothetical protein
VTAKKFTESLSEDWICPKAGISCIQGGTGDEPAIDQGRLPIKVSKIQRLSGKVTENHGRGGIPHYKTPWFGAEAVQSGTAVVELQFHLLDDAVPIPPQDPGVLGLNPEVGMHGRAQLLKEPIFHCLVGCGVNWLSLIHDIVGRLGHGAGGDTQEEQKCHKQMQGWSIHGCRS